MSSIAPPRQTVSNVAAIPEDMRALSQWIVWRQETTDKGKLTKVPYIAGTTRKASTTDPETWRAFEVARRCYQAGACDGIGFVFSDQDPYVFVDLDHCVDPSGVLSDQAQAILAGFGTYAERSPNDGIHLFARGALTGDWHRHGNVEIYWSGRFSTVTGAHIDGTPAMPQVVGAPLQQLYASLAPIVPDTAPDSWIPEIHGPGLSDADVLNKAGSSRHGGKFRDLMDGLLFGYGDDQSAADLALCGMLAYWCRNDTAQMDRLFRQSKLMREKWDSRRGRSTYGRDTLEKACGPVVYTPWIPEIHGPGNSANAPPGSPKYTDQENAAKTQEIDALQAAMAELRAENGALRQQIADLSLRVEMYQAEPLAQLVAREQARASLEEAAHKALIGILEHPDLTFRQRVVVALAKDEAGAYVPRQTFGTQAQVPEPRRIAMRELEQRAGIAEGSAAASLKPAAGLGLISREMVPRQVTLPDGTRQVRTEIFIGPGTGQPQPNWRDRKRELEAERARSERAERKSTEDKLLARIDELEAAEDRAAAGCTCGGDLVPTGYFCPSCQIVATPSNVVSFPKPLTVPPRDGSAPAVVVPLVREKRGAILNNNYPPKYTDPAKPHDAWIEGGDLRAF